MPRLFGPVFTFGFDMLTVRQLDNMYKVIVNFLWV